MPTLLFRFPGGRYHATPTGHHVNEGLVEWPPSPWRLVRALIACGYTTLGWQGIPPVARRLFHALCSALPEYRLPPAALGHSRHYMPTAALEKGREKTTLVLDAFADVGEGQLWVRWPTELDEAETRLLEELAANLGYLGRSESWVEARVVSDNLDLPATGMAFPHVEGTRPGRGYEQLSVSAPELPNVYTAWREQEVRSALATVADRTAERRPTPAQMRQQKKVQDAYPPDVLECLQLDTAWWKERRWSQAPGSRRVLYWREETALEVGQPSVPHSSGLAPVEVVLFSLSTASGSRSALPPIARTLPQAELLHRALISKVGGAENGKVLCAELTGRDASGRPLRGHRHAHILPMDLDNDGHLDHVLVFAPMGLGATAQHALRSVKRTYMKGGAGELQVAVAGRGALSDLRSLSGPDGSPTASIMQLLGPQKGAKMWTTAMPFVPPRHLKRSGPNSLHGQIQAELHSRGLPSAEVEVLRWTPDVLALRHVVRRRRAPAPQPPVDGAFAVRLRFGDRIHGPLCLGYASHFGLGRFVAEPD